MKGILLFTILASLVLLAGNATAASIAGWVPTETTVAKPVPSVETVKTDHACNRIVTNSISTGLGDDVKAKLHMRGKIRTASCVAEYHYAVANVVLNECREGVSYSVASHRGAWTFCERYMLLDFSPEDILTIRGFLR